MYGIYEGGKVIARFVAPLSITSNQPVSVSDTLSLKRQINRRSAQRWEISSNLEPLSYDANTLFANLISKGLYNTVTVLVPQNFGAKFKKTATASITAIGAANSTQVTISGLTSGIIPTGTFVKFANHSKIYLTTSDTTNAGTMNIFPALRLAVSGTSVTYQDDVIMNCLYDTDTTIGMSYSDGILMDMGTVKLIEQL
jgi:hypothetical protein